MLGFYIKSVFTYFVVFWAVMTIFKTQFKNRKDINYNDYIKDEDKKDITIFNVYYVFCFIPIIRLLIIAIVLYLSFATKESLNKLFKKN